MIGPSAQRRGRGQLQGLAREAHREVDDEVDHPVALGAEAVVAGVELVVERRSASP